MVMRRELDRQHRARRRGERWREVWGAARLLGLYLGPAPLFLWGLVAGIMVAQLPVAGRIAAGAVALVVAGSLVWRRRGDWDEYRRLIASIRRER